MRVISRRCLLQGMALLPLMSFYHPALAARPTLSRIIALEWRPVELLMALGITPLAIADKPDYLKWVSEPSLPVSVINVGHRNEPNMELLQRLNPSLVLISRGFGPPLASLTPIAPVLTFAFNDDKGQPLATACRDLLALADFLGLNRQAHTYLAQFEWRLDEARQQLQRYRSRPLLMFSFLDSRRVLILGRNSLFGNVLEKMCIDCAWQGETNFWGSTIVGIERLVDMVGVRAICFLHDDQKLVQEVTNSALWQVIPFVREKQLQLLPAAWFYGATSSALRFIRLLQQALVRYDDA